MLAAGISFKAPSANKMFEVKDLFDATTVAGLAECVQRAEHMSSSTPAIEKVPRNQVKRFYVFREAGNLRNERD